MEKNKILGERFNVIDFSLMLILKAILEITYFVAQYEIFGYYGFKYEPSTTRFIIGWILYIILACIVQRKEYDLYSTFLYVYFGLSFSPAIVF